MQMIHLQLINKVTGNENDRQVLRNNQLDEEVASPQILPSSIYSNIVQLDLTIYLNYSKMGGSDSKIETSSILESSLTVHQVIPPSKYTPPFRKFGDLLRRRNGINKTFVLSVRQPFSEDISLEIPVFEELQEAFTRKTEDINIEHVISDEVFSENWVFQTISGSKKQSLLVRPFSTEDSHLYANILCEVYFAQSITKLNSQYLQNLEDNYVVQTGIDCIEHPNSHVLAMERIDANLSQIIKFRRNNKWDWREDEFDRFLSDLVNGLTDLHAAGISHNDIRPANIYFSIRKNCYLIGNYSNCQKGEAGVGSSHAKQDARFSAPELGHQHQIDLLKGDVYSLGITLLCAFYLCQHIDRKLYVGQNKSLIGKHQVLKIIQSMISPVEERPSISQIKAKLVNTTYKYQSMGQFIQSMYHQQSKSIEDVSASKLATAWAYQRLGLWNQWKKQYDEVLELSQHNSTPLTKANSLLQLAIIDHCRGRTESSSNYAKSAAGIYRQLGATQRQMGVYGAAESYCKKAIGCSKYYEFEHDIDLSRSLQQLSRVHAQRNQYRLARTLAATASNVASKSNGKDSFEWAEIRVQEAKLETDFGAFESATHILDECLIVADRKQGINSQKSRLLRAKILAEKGRNWIKLSQNQASEEERGKMLDLANADLAKAAGIYQNNNIEQDNHKQLAYICRLLGEVQFRKQAYDDAIKDYDRALNLINYIETSQKKRIQQHGDILCLRGTANSFKRNINQALNNYQSAMKIYRQIYGSDHNRHSALAIGNLARVYINEGEEGKARDCLKISCNILRDLSGEKDADYAHFKSVEANLSQYSP